MCDPFHMAPIRRTSYLLNLLLERRDEENLIGILRQLRGQHIVFPSGPIDVARAF